jgi:hypothetical protein
MSTCAAHTPSPPRIDGLESSELEKLHCIYLDCVLLDEKAVCCQGEASLTGGRLSVICHRHLPFVLQPAHDPASLLLPLSGPLATSDFSSSRQAPLATTLNFFRELQNASAIRHHH